MIIKLNASDRDSHYRERSKRALGTELGLDM